MKLLVHEPLILQLERYYVAKKLEHLHTSSCMHACMHTSSIYKTNLPVHFYLGTFAGSLGALLLNLGIQTNASLRQSKPRPGPLPPRIRGCQSNGITLVGGGIVPRLEGADAGVVQNVQCHIGSGRPVRFKFAAAIAGIVFDCRSDGLGKCMQGQMRLATAFVNDSKIVLVDCFVIVAAIATVAVAVKGLCLTTKNKRFFHVPLELFRVGLEIESRLVLSLKNTRQLAVVGL